MVAWRNLPPSNPPGLDVNNDGSLVLASTDRITDTDTVFESYSSAWWVKTTTVTYPTAGSGTAVTTSRTRQRLTGFSGGVQGETQVTDIEGNTVTTVATVNRSTKTVTTTVTAPGLSNPQTSVVVNGLVTSATGFDGLATTQLYDALGRPTQTTDARSNTTTTAYYSGTPLVHTVTDAASHVVSTVGYDGTGRTAWTQDALGKYTRFAYNPRGQLTNQWGDAAYPVAYGYDSTYGDRTSLSTYRGAPAADSGSWPSVGTADTTTWTYDEPTGLLGRKTDAASHYVTLHYDSAGRTSRRTLARGVYTDYGYDSATGELLTQTYSDGTPSVTYAYTRAGQADSVADYTGTWDYVYGDGARPWRQTSTTLPSFYGTRAWTALYDNSNLAGRSLGFQLGSSAGSAADLEQDYAWSGDGRFDTLATKRSGNSVTRTFDYSYLANTPFVSGIAVTGGHPFSVSRGYESNRDLLSTIDSQWSGASVARFDYTHDERYQRATAAQSGSAFADYYAGTGYSHVFNNYTYNARGELQTAAMYRGDTPSPTPSSGDELPGRRFEYRFDSLGNRATAGETGSPGAADDEYTANALNQYTQKENNTVRVLGTAASSAHVAVLGAAATGKLDRAWGADLVPANGSAAAGGTATAYAAIIGGGSGGADLIKSLSQPFFIPKALQAFTYDDDGNLAQDSVWDYQYDAENRLVAMQNRSEVIGTGMIAGADARRLEFKYDYKNRRVRKTVYGGWNGSTYATTLSDTKFLYDGANLIAEFDALSTLTLTRSFTWGLDLQGSLTASGGVGALLQIRDEVQNKTLLPTYDGNGNVAALLNADTGALEAAYEYDPFGNLLRAEGTYAAANHFRFSSKFQDDETGLVYYGLRYYSPTLGRFINKDPIEEMGGLNLYAFCSNNGVNRWDYLGQIERVKYMDGGRETASTPDFGYATTRLSLNDTATINDVNAAYAARQAAIAHAEAGFIASGDNPSDAHQRALSVVDTRGLGEIDSSGAGSPGSNKTGTVKLGPLIFEGTPEWAAAHAPNSGGNPGGGTAGAPGSSSTTSAGAQSLSYKTIVAAQQGANGSLNGWVVQWLLANPSAKGGWIVQHITVGFNVTDSSGKPVTHPADSGKWNYWEAWQVGPGGKVTTYAATGDVYDDMYRISGAGPGTRGTVTFTGEARFYEGLNLPSSFVPNNPNTYAGILPATTVDPKLPTNNATPPVDHSIIIKWP
ncbi:MAG: RHS repeat-associated core domain-containing protein [Lacunisphaera sp.]